MQILQQMGRLAVMAVAAAAFAACGGGDFIQVSAGGSHTCALRSDGSVVCWGDDEWGQLRAPEDERFTSIAAGAVHTCGLRDDGTTACWGSDLFVRYPEAPEEQSAPFAPVFPPEDEQFTSIVATAVDTCVLRADGSVTCWETRREGRGEYAPFEMEQFVEISGSPASLEICGLREDGSGLCVNYHQYLNPSELVKEIEDTPAGEQFVSFMPGLANYCGLRLDGSDLCWGDDSAGQFPPEGVGPFSEIALGYFYSCGLLSNGSVECWGFDWERYAEPWRSPGTTAENWTTEQVLRRTAGVGWVVTAPRTDPPQGERFKAISAGGWHTCGLRQDGGISCWGYNEQGQASPP